MWVGVAATARRSVRASFDRRPVSGHTSQSAEDQEMGSATQRKLASLGVHDKPTVRAMEPITSVLSKPTVHAMEPITSVVSDSQILNVATAAPRRRTEPARRRRPTTLSDFVAQSFFADGERQEASGVYAETEHVRIRSLDRVPRRWWPGVLAFCLVTAAAAAGGWWLGLRPPAEWQRSRAWQAMHLPQMPPPAQPRWRS
jgi:hypothetical protein